MCVCVWGGVVEVLPADQISSLPPSPILSFSPKPQVKVSFLLFSPTLRTYTSQQQPPPLSSLAIQHSPAHLAGTPTASAATHTDRHNGEGGCELDRHKGCTMERYGGGSSSTVVALQRSPGSSGGQCHGTSTLNSHCEFETEQEQPPPTKTYRRSDGHFDCWRQDGVRHWVHSE